MATNIYLRGTTLWWRRNVRFGVGSPAPINVRISLKTRCPREARARAGYLETETLAVTTRVADELKTGVTPGDMRAVYKAGFEAALDRYIVQQAATPFRADAHAAFNVAYARYFTLIASSPGLPEADDALRAHLTATGLTPNEAHAVFMLAAQHHDKPAISHNYLADYVRQAGLRPTEQNLQTMVRVVAAAYRNACLAATEELDRPNPEAEVWPLPGPLRRLLDLPGRDPAPGTAASPPDDPTQTSPVPDCGAQPVQADGKLDVTLSALAAACLSHRIDSQEWREDRRRDVEAAVALFVAANGDLLLSRIDQRAGAAMTALFSRLPTRYGHTREDIAGGIAAVLARGATLKTIWDCDPIAAERDLVPTLGLNATTRNKHIHWIGALFKFADANGYVTPKVDFGKLRQKVRKVKGGRRLPWAEQDLHRLVSGPIWTGCAGLWNRSSPGETVFHDGIYWGLPLLVCSGGRSEETAGAMLADIFEDVPISYLYIRENPYRKLKNGQSDRKVPISPWLIRLGFLDYVREMRKLGHELLFPEFYNPKKSMSFDHVFYDKVFEPLRAHHFPNGTSQKRGRKDVDAHSTRTRAATLLRNQKFEPGLRHYLLGHVPDGETAASYEAEPGLDLLLPLVTALGDLLQDLPIFALNLRPLEWQRFGSPRGRRAK